MSTASNNEPSADETALAPERKRKVIARAFNALVVVSVIALVVYLYRNDLLYVPHPRHYDWLVASLVLLVLGNVLGPLSWWRVLRLDFDNIPLPVVVGGTALATLGKYLPGKLWVVAGRAAYVANASGESLVRLTTSSTKSQVINVWVGVSIGLIGAAVIGGPPASIAIILAIWALLFLFIVSGVLEWFGTKVLGFVQAKPTRERRLDVGSLLRVLPYFLPGPVLRMIGFYVMAASIVGDVPWQLMFAFPLATALGMAAVFAPGGIGVREAVLVAAMLELGLSLKDATTIAVTARLWAVVGDVIYFGIGLLIDRRLRGARRSGPQA